jgi:anti-sigma regulatory factor (Ser/Thr protein kinase)
MGRGESLHQRYPAAADSIPLARAAVSTFAESAGATTAQLDAIKLAVSEAATNVVIHAYGGHPGEIEVDARLASGELWIQIADDGLGMRPNIDSPARPNIDSPARPNIDSPGLGVGVALISQAADAFAISNRASGGTEVQMRFDLRAGRAARSPRNAIAWAAAPA